MQSPIVSVETINMHFNANSEPIASPTQDSCHVDRYTRQQQTSVCPRASYTLHAESFTQSGANPSGRPPATMFDRLVSLFQVRWGCVGGVTVLADSKNHVGSEQNARRGHSPRGS